MIFHTSEQWAKWGVTNVMEKLFAMRWQELFDEETFDSWQLRYACPVSVLREVSEAITVLRDTPVAHHNVKHLLDEAQEIFAADPVIARHFELAQHLLSRVSYADVKSGAPKRIALAEKQVRVIADMMRGYRQRLTEELAGVLGQDTGVEKGRLLALTDRLATHLTKIGYTSPFLREVFAQVIQEETTTPLRDRVGRLLEGLSGEACGFTCYCLVRWPNRLLDMNHVAFDRAEPTAPALLSDTGKAFRDGDQDASVVSLHVQAMDLFGARQSAVRSLGQVHAMFRLYAPSQRAVRAHDDILVVDADGNARVLGKDESRLRYVRDARHPENGVSRILDLEGHELDDYPAILSSLQYHRLHADALTDEARLVNLWIALETVVPRREGSVIGSVSEYVPCSLASGYVSSTIRALALSCKYLWVNRDTGSPFSTRMRRSSEKFLHPDDLLQVMTDADEGDLIRGFMAFAADHPLLVNRINTLWEEMFKDGPTLARRIESHQKHVEWQLRRIYRTRNYVMHNGTSVPGVRHLVQHLHTYYVTFMHHLIYDLRELKVRYLEEALIHRKGRHAYLLKCLKEPARAGTLTTDSVRLLRFDEAVTDRNRLWGEVAGPEGAEATEVGQ